MPGTDLPAHRDDLAEVLAEAIRLFARGVADRRSAFRTPTVATIAAESTPQARTMVLRRFEPVSRRLTFHSDQRASKFADFAHIPRAAVHIYDARAALQIRLSTHAQVHIGDAVAQAAWAAGAASSRAIYAIDPAPGTEVPAPVAAPTDPDAGFGNFAVLTLTFDRLEWLWLHHAGHRRARFAWDAGGTLDAAWLIP